MKQKETMKKSETMKQTTSVNKCIQLNSKEFGPLRVVTNEKEAKGYFCLDDLCRILDLNEKVAEQLTGHLFLVTVDGGKDQQWQKCYVEEEGLYLMMLISKMEDAIRFQEWLVFATIYRDQEKMAGKLFHYFLLQVQYAA